MAQTRIDWADCVWNIVTGCSPVSEGCEHCYARRFAQRLRGRFGYPADEPFRATFHEDRLQIPFAWRTPRRVFVNSMGDLFHEDVELYNVMRVFNVMAKATQHTFVILTKRPQRMLEFYRQLRPGTVIPGPYFSITGIGSGFAGSPPPLPRNIWLGVSCENQRAADERIPILLQVQAAVRFVSCEPLLGPIGVGKYLGYVHADEIGLPQKATGQPWPFDEDPWYRGVDWVIVGAETGPGARPYRPEWVQGIIDQCRDARVPIFLKDNLSWPQQIQEFPGDPLEALRQLADEYKCRTGLDDDEAVEAVIKRAREM